MEVLHIASTNDKEPLVNEDILKAGISQNRLLRVIGPDGEQLGLMRFTDALSAAYDKGLDLVLMNAQGENPVCKCMDYGKYRYERDKRKKEARKNQKNVETKEIQLKINIDVNDFNVKANRAVGFLKDGNKVKVLVIFRGRQLAYTDVGRELCKKFAAAVQEAGTVDKAPVMEGRSMSMMIVPIKAPAAN